MKCMNCNAEITDTNLPCSVCGAKNDSIARSKVSKREFYKNFAPKEIKKQIKTALIITYSCIAGTLAFGFLSENTTIIADVILLIALALGIQLLKSRACSVILMVYSIINLIVGLVLNGHFTGWMMVIAAIYSIKSTYELEAKYTAFKSGY